MVPVVVTDGSTVETSVTVAASDERGALRTVTVTPVPPTTETRLGLTAETTGRGRSVENATGSLATPLRAITIDRGVPAGPIGTVTLSCVSLIRATVAALPPTVALIRLARNSADVVPKPEPLTVSGVALS